MLQKLNERIQGVVAWVVVILIALTFTLFGIDYYLQSRHESNVQVEVNNEPISKQTFELNYRRTRQSRDPALLTAESENQLKQQVMDALVVSTVSLQSARANGFEVGVSQANAAILNIPQFQEDGHFSTDRYQQALSGALFTPDSFQKEVRQGMLLNQQRFAFIGTAFGLPNEINKFVKLYMQTRNYEYLTIPMLPFVGQAAVSPEEVIAYFQQHQNEFRSPEKVSVDFIRLSMPEIKDKITVSDDQIKRYYDENQENYFKPAQWKVAHILLAIPSDASSDDIARVKKRADDAYEALVKNPNQFADDVKTLSDDKISSSNGGVLPWIVAGQSEFDKALVKATTPGDILPPYRTSDGYEILKLIAYTASSVKPLEDVQAEIKEQLLAELAQANYTKVLEQLSDLSYQTPDSLSPVAEALNLTIQETPLFSRQGGPEGTLASNKQVIDAAFSHDVLELGNNSEPVQVDNDSVIVLRVNKHVESSERTLDEVKPKIVEKLSKMKARVAARQLGKIILGKNQDQASIAKLMKEHRLDWHEVKEASRDTDTTSSAIADMAFHLPRVGARVGRNVPGGDYVIVSLKAINDGQFNMMDKEQVASITQQIEANYGMMDYDLYVSDLMSKAKIVKH